MKIDYVRATVREAELPGFDELSTRYGVSRSRVGMRYTLQSGYK
jgi:hypothetical protein